MKVITTGNLHKIIKERDENTIIRVENLTELIQDLNIKHHKVSDQYLIDFEDFFKKINPKNLSHHYKIPKLRNVRSATSEYNKTHKKQISYHEVERCLATDNVSYIKTKRYYLINYEELEEEIEKQSILRKIREI